MDDNNNNYNNNNGTKVITENGKTLEQFSIFPNSSEVSQKMGDSTIFGEFQSKDDSVKMKMEQYTPKYNTNNNISKLNEDEHLKKMKSNKEEEKDPNMPYKEINQNELNIFNQNNFKKETELITNLIKEYYKKCYLKGIYCDYRTNPNEEWKIGLIDSFDDNYIIVRDEKSLSRFKIKIDEFSNIAYFRKYSKCSKKIYFTQREKINNFNYRLKTMDEFIDDNHFINDKKDIFEIYYIMHSKMYFGLDSAMKIDDYYDNNEGFEESFRIILKILLFISQYYKYILDNNEDFINYESNIDFINKSEFIDLKVVNKKYAFFSFFDESINILNKIFANEVDYLTWYIYFEKQLIKIVPSAEDKKNKPKLKPEFYPIYEAQKKRLDKKFNCNLLLKKICFENAYDSNVTFTVNKIQIKAAFVSYFIDYFYALKGFKYLFQLCICNKSISIGCLNKLLRGIFSAFSLAGNYKDLFLQEKQELGRFVYNFIEQLNEKTIIYCNKQDILEVICRTSKLVSMKYDDGILLKEDMYLTYISKKFLVSKKLDQRISCLNILIDILNNIQHNMQNKKYKNKYSDLEIEKMKFQDFCVKIKNKEILKIILNEKNVHEEIIKRLQDIIFTMYKNNFGYLNETDEAKVKEDKKMIFDVLFNKLREAEKNLKNDKIHTIFINFCEFLSEEDKFYVFKEIKNNFEKITEKEGMPNKEQLLFIIDFTARAIFFKNNNNKENNENKNINNNNKKDDDNREDDEEEEEDDEIIENEEISSKNDDVILFSFVIEDKNFYGLNLLNNFLSDKEYEKYKMSVEQKRELILTSIEGIIKIIKNCEKKEQEILLKKIFFKGVTAFEKSTDVAQFLILFDKLRKTRNNYTKVGDRFTDILENYSFEYRLLTCLMNNMSIYFSLINSVNKKEKNNLDYNINEIEDLKEEQKVYEGFFNNELNINLRLELIIFLLQNENNNCDIDNTNTIFKQLINLCQTNILSNNCLNKLLYLKLKNFEVEYIKFLYDNILVQNKVNSINDMDYYKLCKEIIKKINKIVGIFHFMNNKDLAVIYCEDESQIRGIDFLYNALINTKSYFIRNDITDFLSDIFLGVKSNEKGQIEKFWNNIANNIYKKLDYLLKERKGDNELGIQGIISLIKKIENKSNEKGQIIKDVSRIKKEISINKAKKNKIKKNQKNKNSSKTQKTSKDFSFRGFSGENGQLLNYDIKVEETDYFYMLRYQLSNFYKMPLNTITATIDEQQCAIGKLKNIEFNLFNDFDNIYTPLNELEKKFSEKNKGKKNPLIFEVKSIKNEKLNSIKNIIKKDQQLTELLKQKNAQYTFDVWLLVKEENQKNNANIIQNIKNLLLNNNEEKINSFLNFDNTNIYYISYILSNLMVAIDELNKGNNNFINKKLLTNSFFIEKIKKIKIDDNNTRNIGEIYEKNNIIKYLLNIFSILLEKSNDKSIVLFIVNKIIDFYYITINQCINIELKTLQSQGEINAGKVENLYLENMKSINEIINKHFYIIEVLIEILISTEQEQTQNIKHQLEYLFIEGLLKNKYNTLNQKLSDFIKSLIDNEFLNKKEKIKTKESFFNYLLKFFLSDDIFKKLINYIKELSNNKRNGIFLNIELFEDNIILLYDIIAYIFEKYKLFNSKINYNNYISTKLLPSIFNPIIDGVSLDLSFHEILLGGNCKLLLSLLSNSDNYKDLFNSVDSEKQLRQYLFNEIIMNNCNKNILNERNLDNNKTITISSTYAFTQAVNLFVFLFIQNITNSGAEEEINNYLNKLTEFHNLLFWKNEDTSSWKLSFKENKKTVSYVGLKNLGCTCYMNSLIQIFFNLVPFRESILKCKCKEESKNSLYQLKKLFFSLKYLKTSYFTPTEFTQNLDDEKLNVYQQMDVDEFYINILDKIENRLRGTENENLVKYFFQGRQNDLLTFQDGCTHHRINTNNFYSIQLQVKNKKNIYESLDSLIEGELMDGDNCIFCQKCNKKRPVVKSQNFKTLPRILLFVLKRFEFDYNTMKKLKINDHYEFPFELDMTKYKSENNADNKNKNRNNDQNKYILKSIVVHMGNCENGHYYSYIKTDNEKWYEFNDTHVSQLNENLLNEETFGGFEMVYMNGEETAREKNRNAYLLFYEKKSQTDCEEFNKIEAINSYLGIKKNRNEEVLKKNEYGMTYIVSNINEEMFKYFLTKKLFSNEYQYFILELFLNILNYYKNYILPVFFKSLCRNLCDRPKGALRETQTTQSNLNYYLDNKKLILFDPAKKLSSANSNNKNKMLDLFKHFIIYFYNVFLRTSEKKYFGCMVDLIKFFINDQPDCANYLIEEFCNNHTMVEYLINCPLYDIKKVIVGIIYCAMIKSVDDNSTVKEKQNHSAINEKNNDKKSKNLYEKDEELARKLQYQENNNLTYLLDGNNNPLDYKNIPKNILKMIYNMLHLMRDTKYNRMNEYRFLFFTIYRFSLISPITREFLIYKCRLFELLCLLLHKNHKEKKYNVEDIIISTYMGPYVATHNILNEKSKEKKELNMVEDKAGVYRSENYLYMLFFYLLSFKPSKESKINDIGYSLENENFITVLMHNIRTKQDAFCFSNFIIEKSDSKKKVENVYEVLFNCLEEIDDYDKINYDYNNYNNFVNNNMNENPVKNDPGINPKYLFIIIKKYIGSCLNKEKKFENYLKKSIKKLFELFNENQNYYSYSIMIIDLILELFSTDLKELCINYQKDFVKIRSWLETYPIPPIKYNIEGIKMYKYKKLNYNNNNNNLSEKENAEFEEKELIKSNNKIQKIYEIFNSKNPNNKGIKDIDLSDFKFIIGDIILYQDKERVIEEALDEQLKISVDINQKNNNGNDKKETWIEIDNPTIEIKELKEK